MFRHDVYLDATREAANTPPPQFESVLDGLSSDVSLTYFYNHSDRNAIDAKDLLTVAARQNPHFHFSAVDIDKEPAKARAFGARAYNTAVVETDGRRVVVENTADLTQMAFATLRVLKKKVDVVCFVTGHGESVPEGPPHFHYSHVETLRGHETPGAGDLLQGDTDGLDRLQLATDDTRLYGPRDRANEPFGRSARLQRGRRDRPPACVCPGGSGPAVRLSGARRPAAGHD